MNLLEVVGLSIKTREIRDLNPVWEKELGRKGEGDFIRITATFLPEIAKRYDKEWDDLYG